MPYEADSEGDWGTDIYGFINAQTFEIVIPAKYAWTQYFIGGYAIVKKHPEKKLLTERSWFFSILSVDGYGDSRNYAIINKKDEEVIVNFDYAALYRSADGSTTFALTANNEGSRNKLEYDFFSFIFGSPRYEPTRTVYRLYNLNTGKRVLGPDSRYCENFFRDSEPCIRFTGPYMIYDDDVYAIKNDGSLEKTAMTVQELQKSNAPRETPHAEIELDIDALLQNIPDDLALIWRSSDDFVHLNGTLYQLKFGLRQEKDEKYTDQSPGVYLRIGVYDAAENKWIIRPNRKCYQTEYDNWIYGGDDGRFYDIAARKKYNDLYGRIPSQLYNIYDMGYAMYYRGYLSRTKAIVKDF